MRFGRPLVLAALAALLLAGAAVLAGCAGRGAEALGLLSDISAGPQPGGTSAKGVAVLQLAYGAGDDRRAADLYLPAESEAPGPAEAALVLVPGLAPEGKDDPRLIALARALAKVRIAVLVPDIASLRELRAGPENVRDIADALRFLAGDGRARWAPPGDAGSAAPIGVAAVSYAVGPALLATLEPGLPGRVAFLVGIGGYHDMTAALTFLTTGWYRDLDGAWHHRAPNAYGKWAFVMANAGRVRDARDRTSLAAMARRRLGDLDAPIDDLAAALGPEGQAVHSLVTNRDRARVPALIEALPAPIRADMAALDLAGRDLTAAPPRILLIHGRDDAIIPASESVGLAAALPAGGTELVLLEGLAHADLGPGQGSEGRGAIGDFLRMWRAAAWLLAVRDGAS